VLLAYIMWSAVYSGRTQIAGFSLSMMITYYIISSFFKRLDSSDGIVGQLSSEIREGQFTKYLVKPIKPLLYFAFSSFSKTCYVLGINICVASVWAVIFKKYFIMPCSITGMIYAVLINFLGLCFLMLLNYFTAILSFKFVDVTGLNIIKNNILEFLAGTLVPLALLPVWIQGIMKFFPFYYIFYLPAMLYMERETKEIPMAFAVLTAWNAAMLAVNLFFYRYLEKSYEGVGI
jgi:ABC-2 type transport system permease protein